MSEANELVEEITLEFEDADVVPVPIDPTLTISGQAADAKATGDAIAAAVGNLRINEKAPVSNAVTLYASDIKMSSEAGANTIAEAVEAAASRDANDIMYDSGNLVSVKSAIDSINTVLDSELSTDAIDAILAEVFGG